MPGKEILVEERTGGAPSERAEDLSTPRRHERTVEEPVEMAQEPSDRRFSPSMELGSLAEEERRLLQCLGAAVVGVWESLPRDVQRALFEQAAAQPSYDTAELRRLIAVFLHDHNG